MADLWWKSASGRMANGRQGSDDMERLNDVMHICLAMRKMQPSAGKIPPQHDPESGDRFSEKNLPRFLHANRGIHFVRKRYKGESADWRNKIA